jgi:hypothetical protein
MLSLEPLMVRPDPLMVSLSNHEPPLFLRQAQDERTEAA